MRDIIGINAVGIINALGDGIDAVKNSLRAGIAPGMTQLRDRLVDGNSVRFGAVTAVLPEIPEEFSQSDTRNNRLLLAALLQIRPQIENAIARYGASRVGVILGTSNSGIDEGEQAVAHLRKHGALPAHYFYRQQELGDTSDFAARFFGIRGPCYTISTACSSSSRAMIAASRLIRAGVIDAAITGGADAVCGMTLNGFRSLDALSLSPEGCRPFAANRDGITIGEAAAVFFLSREPAEVALLGGGESSDAYHMSAPHPAGEGAEIAMRQALADAGLLPADIGYVNLHGTGTTLNDAAEAAAVYRVFGYKTPCSSTKHLTGHTLGTCGATEAALCCFLLTDEKLFLPAQDLTPATRDPALPAINLVIKKQLRPGKKNILSNSFAFGGNNACLVLGKFS